MRGACSSYRLPSFARSVPRSPNGAKRGNPPATGECTLPEQRVAVLLLAGVHAAEELGVAVDERDVAAALRVVLRPVTVVAVGELVRDRARTGRVELRHRAARGRVPER